MMKKQKEINLCDYTINFIDHHRIPFAEYRKIQEEIIT